jgi:hypothetical protein
MAFGDCPGRLVNALTSGHKDKESALFRIETKKERTGPLINSTVLANHP